MKLETYKGIEIWSSTDGRPFEVRQQNVPVIGTLITGFNTIEEARKYIDKIS